MNAPSFLLLLTILKTAAEAVGAITMAWGVIKGLKLLANRTKLVRERDNALDMVREARDAASGFRLSSEGWEAAVDQLSSQIKDLTLEVRTLRSQLVSAVIYITELHQHLRDTPDQPAPPVPDDLREAMEAILRRRT